MRWSFIPVALLAVAASPAAADFSGFTAIRSEVIGASESYRVVRVYANFTRAEDRLLNAFDVSVSLSGSTDPTFLQAEDADSEVPPSFLPVPFTLPGEEWIVDSFITVGAEQGTFSNGTVADPDFDDSGAASGAGIGGGGWYNLPPTNEHGLAGADYRVLIGQFTVRESELAPDAQLHVTATLGVSSGGTLQFATQTRSWSLATAAGDMAAIDDIDGDFKSDIIFVHPTNNQIFGWLLDGFDLKGFSLLAAQGPANAAFQGIGDVDGDGKADILWRHRTTGLFSVTLLNGLGAASTVQFGHNPGLKWRTIAVSDVDGDRKADILLFNPSNGQVAVWLLDGPTLAGGGIVGTFAGASVLGTGDLNGDGRRDILWRRANGEIWGWLMNGASVPTSGRIANFNATVGATWRVATIADLNGDGMEDVVWRSSTTGMVSSWRMSGLAMTGSAVLHAGLSSAWRIEAAPDIDGDGRREVLWRNMNSGQTAIWTMNDFDSYGGGLFTSASTSWQIARPGDAE